MALENASTQLTPEQAWQRLAEGNARFVAGTSAHPNQDAARRESLAEGQHPFAVIFGCSDSRLAAEIIFDLGLGDTFVVRTAGQVLGAASLGSLEYAVAELEVPLIVVLGHDSCGAVTATQQAAESGKMPTGFVRDLHDAGEAAGVNDMVREHTRQSAERIVDQSKIITQAVDEGRTAVLGVFYNLRDGKAELVSSSQGL
jgi:carbonic anhydrase